MTTPTAPPEPGTAPPPISLAQALGIMAPALATVAASYVAGRERKSPFTGFMPAVNMVLALVFMAVVGWLWNTSQSLGEVKATQSNVILPVIEDLKPRLAKIDRIDEVLIELDDLQSDMRAGVTETRVRDLLAPITDELARQGDEQTRRRTTITDYGKRISVLEDDVAENKSFIRTEREALRRD